MARDPRVGLKIERRPVAALVPYAFNAKTHAPEQVEKIAASIRAFGFNNPVLLAADGTIIAGHGRVLAARRLGMESVPVIVLAHLTPTQRQAYIIADNRIGELAAWDENILSQELAAILADGGDATLTGFDLAAIESLIAGLPDDWRDLRPPAGSDTSGTAPAAPGVSTETELGAGPGAEFRSVTFKLHRSQVEDVTNAINSAKLAAGSYRINPNESGNALHLLALHYMMADK